MPKVKSKTKKKRLPEGVELIETPKGNTGYGRPRTTDQNVLTEVLDAATYRRKSAGFDVEAGERWLDLGGNIGAFALYCQQRDAETVSYEPEPTCFEILKLNSNGECHNAAVSAIKAKKLEFFSSTIEGNHYRGTLMNRKRMMKKTDFEVDNVFIGDITKKHGTFDGIKMDIEGAEHEILDGELLPVCTKFCFEYHTSRDQSMRNMKRRVRYLKEIFDTVILIPELIKIMKLGGMQKSFHDRVIWCTDPK